MTPFRITDAPSRRRTVEQRSADFRIDGAEHSAAALILAADLIPKMLDGRILSDLNVVARPTRTTFHVRAWYTEAP